MLELITLVERSAALSGPALIVLALYGAVKGWWVARWLYDGKCAEVESWKTLYEREKAFNQQHFMPLLPPQERTV